MANKKYQVFISSTYKDLIDARLAVAKSILNLGHIPAAMEYFPAMDEDQLRYIKRIIDQCDYYILIIAGKYGSMDKEGISYTQREYEYALEKGKFVLAFPYDDINSLPRDRTEVDHKILGKLENFRKDIMNGRLVRPWNDPKDLNVNIITALAIAFNEFPQEGWIRSPKNSNEDLLQEINEIRKENENLRIEIENLRKLPTAKVEDLAPLDAEHSITMFRKINYHIEQFDAKLSWIQIFIKIATYLRPAKDRREIHTLLSSNLSHKFKGDSSYQLYMDDFDVILSQLDAHGLIDTKDRRIYAITKAGENLYLQKTVVKIK